MAAILEEYERLTAEKSKLEEEIAAIVEELTSGDNPAGLKGALVDADGFPRGDIDVYRVRHQRHAFATKQYDHKAVMQRIEQILPQVFEAKMAKGKAEGSSEDVKPPTPPVAKPAVVAAKESALVDAIAPREIDAADKDKTPFAVVENVQTGALLPFYAVGFIDAYSPAEWADLHAADQVLVFGTADATNHRNLEAIKEIVMRNIGSPIRVIVRRHPHTRVQESGAADQTTTAAEWEFHELLLTPQQWSGPGVLGCLLMPIQESRP
ncbi:26s proteasome non-atpase regulatory subunit, partial [Globisporangium splendens]